MLDGRWRAQRRAGLSPIGAACAAPASPPTTSPLLGLRHRRRSPPSRSPSAHLPRRPPARRARRACPTCSTAPSPRPPARAGPRGAFFDSVADRVTDALLFGGVAWYLADRPRRPRWRCCRSPCSALSMLISYERAKAESLGFDARGGLMERAERFVLLGIGLLFDSLLVPVLWVMLVLTARHRRAALREGVAPGGSAQRRAGADAARWQARRASRPSGRAARAARAARRPAPVARDAGTAAGRDRPVVTPGYKAGSPLARALPRPVAAAAGPLDGLGVGRWHVVRATAAPGRAQPARVHGPDARRRATATRRRTARSSPTPATGSRSSACPTPVGRDEIDAGFADDGLRAHRQGARRGQGRDPRPARTSAAGSGRALAAPMQRPPDHRRRRAARAARAVRVVRRAARVARHGGRAARARRRRPRCCGRCGTTTSCACCATATSPATASRSSSSASARRCPAGPATLALRTGAPLLPDAVYFTAGTTATAAWCGRRSTSTAPGRAARRRRADHPGRSPHELEDLIRAGARAVAPAAAELAERPRLQG